LNHPSYFEDWTRSTFFSGKEYPMFTKMTKTAAVFILAAVLLVACASASSVNQPQSTQPPTSAPQIANPASQNCVKQGGIEVTHTRGDGSQYGVCVFQDNQQCEEWALYRGECPLGGVKITGYVTEAGTFCGISGGLYTVTGNNGQADEQGTCKLPSGATCDASAFFEGKCP
jgi:putative hemolysin